MLNRFHPDEVKRRQRDRVMKQNLATLLKCLHLSVSLMSRVCITKMNDNLRTLLDDIVRFIVIIKLGYTVSQASAI